MSPAGIQSAAVDAKARAASVLTRPISAGAISEADARAIGVEAYLYFYPLVTMDLTRRQLTNVAAGASDFGGPTNTFVNVKAFPTAEMRAVVRPNFDTLYSSAWLDLTQEPVVVSVPDTGGRYYLLPMLDMWTDVFASPGWRTTGTQAGHFLIVPPGWIENAAQTAKLPAGTQRIVAPTPYVWIIGRTQTDGPQDYAAVHKVQAGFKITALSQWGRAPVAPKVVVDPSIDMTTPPKTQIDNMPAELFFSYAADILRMQPPHLTDEPIIARMQRIGIERGRSFVLANASATVKRVLAGVPDMAQKLMLSQMPTIARVANGWSMNTHTMGVYGNYYLKRAIIAQQGLGANLPEDAVYPLNIGDDNGQPLDGANSYTLHFAADALPPAEAFWSITLYDAAGFQVGNAQNRFALSSWMPLKHDGDGSLDLYFQAANPGGERQTNWLPAPTGPFTLTMRIYAPKSEVLTGAWDPPPVKRQ
ncbi:MAG: DUF1254 domain-containing protein [Hyphomicrobium sp.]|jgi:hypothetical protein